MHLMLDLETLALTPNAVVTQLGWAAFDLVPKEGQIDGIIESGCWHLDVEPQLEAGRVMDWKTISWWMVQEEEPRMKFGPAYSRDGVRPVLDQFGSKFVWSNIEGVWGNGASFDLPIIESLHRDFFYKTPWHYRAPRDTRTLAMLVPPEFKDKVQVKNPVKHSAEHDAIAQAKWMQNCYAYVSRGVVHANGN